MLQFNLHQFYSFLQMIYWSSILLILDFLHKLIDALVNAGLTCLYLIITDKCGEAQNWSRQAPITQTWLHIQTSEFWRYFFFFKTWHCSVFALETMCALFELDAVTWRHEIAEMPVREYRNMLLLCNLESKKKIWNELLLCNIFCLYWINYALC